MCVLTDGFQGLDLVVVRSQDARSEPRPQTVSPKPRWLGFRPEKERTARQEALLSLKGFLHLHLGMGDGLLQGTPHRVVSGSCRGTASVQLTSWRRESVMDPELDSWSEKLGLYHLPTRASR